ncbi:MAG TPA: hypothetical protein DCM05_07800 [Elusimicrobia bacterium]|nr:hypothetical protein [Elusimicrobiota bacterium]
MRLLLLAMLCAPAWAAPKTLPVGPQARWTPPAGFLDEARTACLGAVKDQAGCFAKRMRKAGAPEAAAAFAARLPQPGWLSEYRTLGERIGAAYAVYPFRANENSVCLLVNGTPPRIDIDEDALKPGELESDPDFVLLPSSGAAPALWPGDRTYKAPLSIQSSPAGGERLVFLYRLSAGCRACTDVGAAWIGFDFDRKGRFQGRRLLRVDPLGAFTDPAAPLRAKVGGEVRVRLPSDQASGSRWKLEGQPDWTLLRQTASDYLPPSGRQASGMEVWAFQALKSGTTELRFRYERILEPDKDAEAKTALFRVEVSG